MVSCWGGVLQYKELIGSEAYKALHDLIAYPEAKISRYRLPSPHFQETYKTKIANRYNHAPYAQGSLAIEDSGSLSSTVDSRSISVVEKTIKKVDIDGVAYIAKPTNNIAAEFGSVLFRMASKGMFTTKHDKIYRDEEGRLWSLSKFDKDINGSNFLEPTALSKLAFDPLLANQDFMLAYARMMGVLHVFGEGDSNHRNFFVNQNGKIIKIDNSFFENSTPSFVLPEAIRENPDGYRIMGCAQANHFFKSVILGIEGVNEVGFRKIFKLESGYFKLAQDHIKFFTEGVSDDNIALLRERIIDPQIKAFFKAFIDGVNDAILLAQDDELMARHVARYSEEDRVVANRCCGFFRQNAEEASKEMRHLIALGGELDLPGKKVRNRDSKEFVLSPPAGLGGGCFI